MTISEYLQNINRRFITGISREHTYRGDLQTLLESITTGVQVTNEPARIACGAPDYVLTRKDVAVGYVEAKDIGVDLHSNNLKEQFDRYKSGLNNLIFTDYLDFRFYKDGLPTTSVAIAKVEHGKIIPQPENFDRFTTLIQNFAATVTQTIKSPTKLAEMMAGKAKLMADVISQSLKADDDNQIVSSLKSQMLSFQQMLIHDITNTAFADIYSQTIAYGMFAARYHDPTLETFSRQEAATLIPRSNPFLRKLFQDIAGYDLDERLVWIVDDLVNIFLATDVADIMQNFGKSTKQEDPVVHFYETFLAAYNPALRKARGVWYTPQPVVNFIVRAVDDLLKTEFNLPQGLADTSKIKVKTKVVTKATADRKSKLKEVDHELEVHKVQILDPATGTGTFLAEVVRLIHKKFEGQQGIWSNYVSQHLLPRLNGFELLMASYAMAHLKMDMLLTETGYKATTDQRIRIFLTNSLEEAHPDTSTLFSSWLSDEANQANTVKRDTPVMVVMGNPPYSGESANKGEWIMKLMEDYKKEPGGKEKLKERNPKWINDDYVKFMRYGQHYIEKNGEGILAFINPHGFLDNPTFRGMRWNLLKTYDKIYTIDLHGNSKKREIAPDGSADINVFDIQQGVSINLFIKTGRKNITELGQVFHYDLYGKRDFKYDFLHNSSIKTVEYKKIENIKPDYFFVQKNFNVQEEYYLGFSIDDLFNRIQLGPNSHRDEFAISFDETTANKRIADLQNKNLSDDFLRKKFNLTDNRDWKFSQRRKSMSVDAKSVSCMYRPFDFRQMLYGEYAFDYHRPQINDHLLKTDNYGFITTRQTKELFSVFITNKPLGQHKIATPYDGSYIAPLYIYPEITQQQNIEQTLIRKSNFNITILKQITEALDSTFTNEKEAIENTFAPIDLLDYIYAVLHSPTYREKYKAFLKIDFPRVPYPTDKDKFWRLVQLGGELRQLHLLESPKVEQYITQYPEDGTNVVGKIRFELQPETNTGKVWINEAQYFTGVPQTAWNFYIGGYQPAQKWLKDRKDRELSFEDILHYQKIIVALMETGRVMGEVDKRE